MNAARGLQALVRGARSVRAVRSVHTATSRAMSHPDRMIDPTYPEVVDKSAQLKEPFGYWNSQDRRNFNDPLDEDDDIKTMWVVDEQAANGRVSPSSALLQLLGVFGLLTAVYMLAKARDPEDKKPVKSREFPLNPEAAARRS
ncbi:hypothetical protein PTSG_06090 [Salpingoeca rosetta]|uniref:Uncharacterized protein n=1 Tax=Salpingoeca rosetta (strain ATCC 50818 / BSB-021) TaxID=946362 RepID=F2UDN2_SALR5|nr:uncharacterized protein PTSG_06090 [Salpingoeca rosetta]EGD74727.1 hypothetical protein PTSG_06090 [Salpingoeca rosetta]|eukprot:XP_004992984.1 hypothetical protein PTSG_06090 [Salpingoeca rosetta]